LAAQWQIVVLGIVFTTQRDKIEIPANKRISEQIYLSRLFGILLFYKHTRLIYKLMILETGVNKELVINEFIY
jgi:hypothetical protein